MTRTLVGTPDPESAPEGPVMARSIIASAVSRNPTQFALIVDGKPFPWLVSEMGAHLSVAPGQTPSVTISIPAESVSVLNFLDGEVAAREDDVPSQR